MNAMPFDLRTSPLGPGTVLLEASAGTGKTYTLVGILLRLLLERRIERLDQALVVTFTVAATDELKNRLRAALQQALRACRSPARDPFFAELAKLPDAEALLHRALDDFDRVTIATIHGFCRRLLEEAAFETRQPFTLEFTADPAPLLFRAATDALRSLYRPGTTLLSALLREGKHTPQSLVQTWQAWRRYPNVAVEPRPHDLEGHLRPADDALAAIPPLCDDEAMRRIADIQWKSGKSPFDGDAATALARFRERLATTPALVFDVLLALAPSAYEARVKVRSTHISKYDHPFFVACERLFTTAELVAPHLRAHLLHAMDERVADGKASDRVLTFDDLLARTAAALHDDQRRATVLEAVRARYQVGLIDEFQDTDSLQYDVFADCFAGRTLFLIGDPKQAIYGFRGADLLAYLEARDDAVQRYTLTVNHRSGAPIVSALGNVFTGHQRPFFDARITADRVTANARGDALTVTGDGAAALRWRFVPMQEASKPFRTVAEAEECVIADVAAEASRLLRSDARIDGRCLRPRDLAILTRTNAQATAMQDKLRAIGIPSAIGKAGDIFATDELGELQRFLLAVLHPGDLRRVRAAMATQLWGLDAATLQALDANDDALDACLGQLAHWRRLWLHHGFIVMQEQALVDLRVHERYLAWHGGERRLTNFRQLFELLHAAEHTHRLSPEGLLEWLQHERQHQDDLDYTVRELRLESDDDAAQILTVHGSKGLQYEIVFCPFLWDAKQPRKVDVHTAERGERTLEFDLTSKDPRYPDVVRERFEEELRLAYVAMTRARRRCYVHWGGVTNLATRSAPTWLVLGRELQGAQDDRRESPAWLGRWIEGAKAEAPRWRDALVELAKRESATDVTDVQLGVRAERVPPEEPPRLLPPRRPERLVRARALHSFSSIIAGAPDPEPVPETADPAPTAAPAAAARGIFAFARGPRAGQCLHSILERVDLAHTDSPATATVVGELLTAHGLASADAHSGELDPVADVQAMLGRLAAANAFAGGTTIGALCTNARQVEWQFSLPTSHASVGSLARLFAASTSEPARAQAPRLHALGWQTLRGFLVGFVDLVCEHDGRYWVVDWKSNHLGDDPADYTPDRLGAVMCEHDYVLQYHLYVLALHRHLRARLGAAYDPERQLGGVVYAFLRGALPNSPCGMFHDRVPVSLVAAMDRWANGKEEHA